MTDLQQLFESLPESRPSRQPQSIPLRSTDRHNQALQVTEEGFLDALYRGEFIYCNQSHFEYVREKPYTMVDLAYYLPPCTVLRAVRNPKGLNVLVRGADWWASINVYQKAVWLDVGGESLDQCRALSNRLRDGLEVKPPEEKIVSFSVWSSSIPPSTRRFTDVPWESVADNYPASTRTSLGQLATLTRDQAVKNGKIILFHGRPGTGKTWAIRSLLTAWKEWTEPIVMIDPEEMLSSPEYFLDAMNGVGKGAVRILVIEDADQIVEKDGTRSADLSRMLNLTDGLIGADSDLIVLLSTNASPGQLDGALLRPGRCLATINFEPFPAHEASTRIGKPVTTPHTLAEIYRATGNVEQVSNQPTSPTGQYL